MKPTRKFEKRAADGVPELAVSITRDRDMTEDAFREKVIDTLENSGLDKSEIDSCLSYIVSRQILPGDTIVRKIIGLRAIQIEFMRLLQSHQREEVFQKFIEENPILLRQFPAVQILFKPPILTYHIADFAVLSPQRELILIEIETPDTRLLKKDGDQAALLTHAIDQVQRWLHVRTNIDWRRSTP
jgi:hypothetical protein